MNDRELVDFIETSALPRAIRTQLINALQAGLRNRWHDELDRQGAVLVDAVVKQLRQAARIANVDVDTLIRSTDFHPNDLAVERLDSAIAEVRSIVWLGNEGFSNIKVVPGSPGGQKADLNAVLGTQRYEFDVCCSGATIGRVVEHLRAYIEEKARKKAGQLSGATFSRRSARSGLIVVLNSDPALVLGYQEEYRDEIAQALARLENPPRFHVAVVTGREAMVTRGDGGMFVGPDDVVYPPWVS